MGLASRSALKPVQVAQVIFKQVRRRGPRRRVIPWFAKWTATLYRLCPQLVEWVAGKALKSMRSKQQSPLIIGLLSALGKDTCQICQMTYTFRPPEISHLLWRCSSVVRAVAS